MQVVGNEQTNLGETFSDTPPSTHDVPILCGADDDIASLQYLGVLVDLSGQHTDLEVEDTTLGEQLNEILELDIAGAL